MPADGSDLDRARTLAALRRFREAEVVLRSLLSVAPDDPSALELLADVLLHDGRPEPALEVAERAVAAAPEHPRPHVIRSSALLRLRRYDEAVSAAREGVRLAPHQWDAHYALGSALREGPRPRLRSALRAAQEALRLGPHESSVHNLLGLCLDDRGRHRAARRAFQQAVRIDPANAAALNNLAASDVRRGHTVRGASLLTAALSHDSAEPVLRHNYNVLFGQALGRCLILLALWGLALFGMRDDGAPWPVRLVALALVLPSYVLVAGRLVARLPRGVRTSWRTVLHSLDWPRRSMLAFLVAGTATLACIALAPAPVADGAFAVLFDGFLGAVAITALVSAAQGLRMFPHNLRRLFWPARWR